MLYQYNIGAEVRRRDPHASSKQLLGCHVATPIEPTTPSVDTLLDHDLVRAEVLANRGEVASVTLLRRDHAASEKGQALLDAARLQVVLFEGSTATVSGGQQLQSCYSGRAPKLTPWGWQALARKGAKGQLRAHSR